MNYLAIHLGSSLTEPTPLNVDALLDRAIWRSHGYMLDLVDSFDDPAIEARTLVLEEKIQFLYPSFEKLEFAGRPRFTACHECGHVILHAAQLRSYAFAPSRMKPGILRTYEDPEWQAEHFAGALLMPLVTIFPLFKSLRESGCMDDELEELIAEKYIVSNAAAECASNK